MKKLELYFKNSGFCDIRGDCIYKFMFNLRKCFGTLHEEDDSLVKDLFKGVGSIYVCGDGV